MKKKKFVSIKTKMVTLLVASAGITLLISSVVIFTFTLNHTQNTVLKNLSLLTTVVGQNLSAPLEFDDKDAADLILNSMKTEKTIKAAYIFKNIELFTSYVKKGESKNLISETILYVYGKNNKKVFIKYIDYNDIVTSYPIYSGGDFLGTFTLVSSTSEIKDMLISQAEILLIVAFVVLILIFLISLKVQGILTKPIFKLKSTMDSFINDPTKSIHLGESDSNDEFNSLYRGFKVMLENLLLNKDELEHLNYQKQKSITYALMLQKAFLPKSLDFATCFSDNFLIYRPKDKLSGEIYLKHKIDKNRSIIMLVECKGRGMNGVYISMLMKEVKEISIAKLTLNDSEITPSSLLATINRNMINAIKDEDEELKREISFCASIIHIDNKSKKLLFSGSNMPMYYTDKNEVIQKLEEDENAIDLTKPDSSCKFVDKELVLHEGMKLYLMSDGYGLEFDEDVVDILQNIQNDSFRAHKELLLSKIDKKYEQIDDITIIGLKV